MLVGGWQEGLLAVGLTGVPVLVVLATVPDSREAHTVALIASVVAGVLLLIAALSFYFHWLTTPSRRHGWTATATVVLAIQVLTSSADELAGSSTQEGVPFWDSAVDVLGTALVLGLMLLGGRAVPNPQPLLLGLGLGVVVTVLQTSGPVGPDVASPSVTTTGVLLTILAGHLVIAWLVMRDRSLMAWARTRLASTVVLVGIALAARSGAFETTAADLTAAVAQVAAAALWASVSFVLLRDALVTQHRRSIGLEESLLEREASLRGSREQLHEVRSTVAGVASAARLLDDATLGGATQARLEHSIRTELDRLERLVAQTSTSPGPVDLDATLDVLLESHRAQGRTVVWEPTGGEQVLARPDDVAEALNILLDNAATHGGTASRVAVRRAEHLVEIAVSDEGPGVPLEAREAIFDWGVHGNDSPGEGIGLSVARRLVSEHGGTLTLAERGAEHGSSFIIRLPAARRPEDDHVHDLGQSA